MKPLNEAARKKAISKFISMYGLSVLAVLLISYLLFSAPLKILRQEAENFNAFKKQHTTLRNKLNGISTQITDIVEVEKVIDKNPSPALDSMAAQYKTGFSKIVTDLKNHSTNEKIPLFKNDLVDYVTAFEAVLFYSRLTSKVTEVPRVIIKENSNTAEMSQLETDHTTLKNAYKILTEENKNLKTMIKTESGRTTGPDPAALQLKLMEIERDRDECKSQLRKFSEDLKNKDGVIKNKDDQIAALNSKSVTTNLSETEKAVIAFQVVDQVVKKGPAAKKRVLVGLKNVLLNIQKTYPDKGQLDRKLNEINELLKTADF